MSGRHLRTDRPARRSVPGWLGWAVLLAAGLAVAVVGINARGSTGPAGPAGEAVRGLPTPTTATAGPATSAQSPSGLPTGPVGAPAPQPAPVSTTSPPVHLLVPAAGIDTPLEALGVIADGSMQSPTQWGEAGWYSVGVRPGDTGPAIIAGHVDSRHGPAVFYHLRNLKPGDVADVQRQDGSVLHFVVDTVASYPKNAFPTTVVYGPTPDAELRLITCTGDFDWTARSYLDNLVVSAHLVP